MRNTLLIASIGLLVLNFSLAINASETNSTKVNLSLQKVALKAEAIVIVKKFGGTLKPHLKSAMKSSGPVAAIEVCSVQAPAIAEQLTKETGWSVKRVSLKARNNSTATPDAWETKVLQQFDERQANGQPAKKIGYAEIVDGQYRFMKAQGVVPLCLKCHGEQVQDNVLAALKLHYPKDTAMGYKLGEIRGAFSLTKDLD
ncbi:MAG: DUF3365 domain-containing protein [Gammaproteobacteria bacterium]|nr:DUF3365 domain-containing protein [Gammaproteobacteria bacterium]